MPGKILSIAGISEYWIFLPRGDIREKMRKLGNIPALLESGIYYIPT
jgi:hypothetical protein